MDDAPDTATLLKLAFQLGGYAVDTALMGEQALELAQRTSPDLIILDLGLLDMDGLDVCREIRQTSSMPIMMLTKRNSGPERQQGLATGASTYITSHSTRTSCKRRCVRC